MLVLSRAALEAVVVDGNITLRILSIEGNQVRIGVEAPKHIEVHREEVYLRILANKTNTDKP